MANPELVLAILGFVTFSIPIIAAMSRLFGIREQLQANILANRHQIELLKKDTDHLIDQQELALNGIKEQIQHVRDRSLHSEALLDSRLSDLEQFIEKSTTFERRKKG